MFFISYGRYVYVGYFSEKMKLADFGKFISEFILILRKKKQKKGWTDFCKKAFIEGSFRADTADKGVF